MRILLYLQRSLKLEQKMCLDSRACQLNYNTRGPEKKWEVVQTNVITLYCYVQQHV